MNTPSPETGSLFPRLDKYLAYAGWILVIAVGVGSSTFAVRTVVDANRDAECRANLTRIGAALQHYHDRCGSFPPAYVRNEQGQRWHSWRVLLLPDLGYADLYHQYRFDEPWDGPHNRLLLTQMPPVYGCPADRKRTAGSANYFAIVGPQTAWPEYCALSIKHVTDGTSNTVCLLESVDQGIAWTEPRDLDYAELKQGSYHSNPRPSLRHTKRMRFLFLDGTVQDCDRNFRQPSFRAICTPAGGKPLPGVDWQLPAAEAAEIQTVPRPAGDLPNTEVTPHLNSALAPGRNSVYCGNFQLAWDRLRDDVVRAPIELEGAPEMARELNQRSFPRDSLADDAYVALAGCLSAGILDNIRAELAAKFPAASPRLVPEPQPTATDGLMAYAYLQKRLPFLMDFDRLQQPLRFHATDGEADVACFGIEDFDSHAPREKALRGQVTVLDYLGPDDFVLQLKPQQDAIVLAKVSRGATLGEALATVQARVVQPRGRDVQPELDLEERLVIPLLSLFVERRYAELIGRPVLNPGFTTQYVADATQLIRFQLDESGAVLDAEAAIVTLNGDEPPPEPRRFVFDRPFLIYLQQRSAQQPYFVMWVENPEVLVPDMDGNASAPAPAKGATR